MVGDERVRFCAECNRNVYNLSAMTALEGEQLVAARTGRMCVRYYRRADGTVLTADCPVGWRTRVVRASRLVGVALSAAMGLSFAAAQSRTGDEPSLAQIENAKYGVEVEVTDPDGAIVSGATVRLIRKDNDTELQRISNLAGWVQFPMQIGGRYEVEVGAAGFTTVRVVLDHPRNQTVRVSLPVLRGGVVVGELAAGAELIALISTSLPGDGLLPVPPPAPVSPSPTSTHRNKLSRFLRWLGQKPGY